MEPRAYGRIALALSLVFTVTFAAGCQNTAPSPAPFLGEPVIAVKAGIGLPEWVLLQSRSTDQKVLAEIGRALVRAPRMVLGNNKGQFRYDPTIDLAILGHGVFVLHPRGGPGGRWSTNWVTIQGPHMQTEALKSAFLYRLLIGQPIALPSPQSLEVRGRGPILEVSGTGLYGQTVTIGISPIYGDGIGGGMNDVAGSFPLATVPVQQSAYHWTGPIRFPVGWRVFHPVSAWDVTLSVPPPKAFPALGGYELGGSLPFRLAVQTSPVNSPAAALEALHQAATGQPSLPMLPIWPSRPESISLAWVAWNGARYSGNEDLRMNAIRGGYRVQIHLLTRKGRGPQHRFESTWWVGRDGAVHELGSRGIPPQSSVRTLLYARVLLPK